MARATCGVMNLGLRSEMPRVGKVNVLMGRDRVFALDWLGLARKGVFSDVLRLFSFRYAYLKNRDPKAYAELVRARKAADPDIRSVAELLFSEMVFDEEKVHDQTAGSARGCGPS